MLKWSLENTLTQIGEHYLMKFFKSRLKYETVKALQIVSYLFILFSCSKFSNIHKVFDT